MYQGKHHEERDKGCLNGMSKFQGLENPYGTKNGNVGKEKLPKVEAGSNLQETMKTESRMSDPHHSRENKYRV